MEACCVSNTVLMWPSYNQKKTVLIKWILWDIQVQEPNRNPMWCCFIFQRMLGSFVMQVWPCPKLRPKPLWPFLDPQRKSHWNLQHCVGVHVHSSCKSEHTDMTWRLWKLRLIQVDSQLVGEQCKPDIISHVKNFCFRSELLFFFFFFREHPRNQVNHEQHSSVLD